jgi:hypothetical protein
MLTRDTPDASDRPNPLHLAREVSDLSESEMSVFLRHFGEQRRLSAEQDVDRQTGAMPEQAPTVRQVIGELRERTAELLQALYGLEAGLQLVLRPPVADTATDRPTVTEPTLLVDILNHHLHAVTTVTAIVRGLVQRLTL